MDFDSPEVAKEFPGLYRGDASKSLDRDSAEYDEETDKKKKKDKKDSKKDKGYAALAAESSQDEEDLAADSKSPGKKILKGFKLSSTKKKDKDKDKEAKKPDKDLKPEKDKAKKSSAELKIIGDKTPVTGEGVTPIRMPFSGERHRDFNAHRSSVPAVFMHSSSTPKSTSVAKAEAPEASAEKAVSALNAFLNAPAPIFSKKKDKEEKEHKKDKDKKKESKKEKEKEVKEHKKDKEAKESKKDKSKDKKDNVASSVAKVKLKLMRSKNSLEDSNSGGDIHVSVSHQFPEDPESIVKEIRKYENLLEQSHLQVKANKKVSKKHEEQLWELQRTLTQLKRKLRSLNALSTASANISFPHASGTGRSSTQADEPLSMSVPLKKFAENSIPPPPESSYTYGQLKTANDLVFQPGLSQNQDIPIAVIPQAQVSVALGSEPRPVERLTTLLQQSSIQDKHESLPGVEKSFPDSRQFDAIGNIQYPTQAVSKDESGTNETSRILQKKTVRRSLDFSNEALNSNYSKDEIKTETQSGAESPIVLSRRSSNDAVLGKLEYFPSSETPPEREKVEVHVMVHSESREEDSSSNDEGEDDDQERIPAFETSHEESIENVVDDANAMIGSMHEELEAAALVFVQQKISSTMEDKKGFKKKSYDSSHFKTKISKSEPTFGEQGNTDSSDVELIRDDEEEETADDVFDDEFVREILALPEFFTEEYLSFENEQLLLFNQRIQEEICKEENEIEAYEAEAEQKRLRGEIIDEVESTTDIQSYSDEQLYAILRVEKAQNRALLDYVSKLHHCVGKSRLEEFKLECRLTYLEDKVASISPVTTTTPLHLES